MLTHDVVAVLASLAGGGAMAAVVVFLARAWISERLSASIRHEYAEKLESFKARLQAESQIAAEKLRADLAILTAEHTITYSRLQDRRATVIADIYALLVETIWRAETFADSAEAEGDAERLKEALDRFGELYRAFHRQRIFLPEEICEHIERFYAGISSPIFRLGGYVRFDDAKLPEAALLKKLQAQFAASDYMTKELPDAKRALEREFRRLITPGIG